MHRPLLRDRRIMISLPLRSTDLRVRIEALRFRSLRGYLIGIGLRVADLANESLLMAPRKLHPRLHDDIIAAVRARGVVLNLAPEIQDHEALWALVASGLGVTFAGERGSRFLDVGGAIGDLGLSKVGSAVWRPLTDLRIVLCDVAIWRADAARSPLLRPLLTIVAELRAQLERLQPTTALQRADRIRRQSRQRGRR
jgi:LysR family transcriptional regulator, benzoate and cis,cis-muconate-responsive activator of ben and cat genes